MAVGIVATALWLSAAATASAAEWSAERAATFFADLGCDALQDFDPAERTYECRRINDSPRTLTWISTWTGPVGGAAGTNLTLYSENTGGSGTFYYLVAKTADGTLSPPLWLGDRIIFQKGELAARGRMLVLHYIGHGPPEDSDPLCCPRHPERLVVGYDRRVNQLLRVDR